MNPRTSVYLDALRAGAALMVFLSHVRFDFFSQGQRWIPDLGHEMVIVFFVLSGFVIAHTHARRPGDWRGFVADRWSRLYSVAIPALLLTALLDHVGSRLAPTLYAEQLPPGNYWARMLLGVTFLNQTWGLSSRTGSNGPFWSLSYEFWYYATFAAWVFLQPGWRRITGVAAGLLLAGPKIVLLLPIWLLGVGAHAASLRNWFPVRFALPVAAGTTGLAVIHCLGSESWIAGAPLYFSGRAGPDFWLGLLVALNILALDAWWRGRPDVARSSLWVKTIRFCANRSFSLYVFHFPILLFVRAVLPYNGASAVQVVLAGGLTLLLVAGLSELSEQRRDPWRRFARRMLGVSSEDGRRRTEDWERMTEDRRPRDDS